MFDTLALANNSKMFWGLTMIMINMGSKYVMADLGKLEEKVLKSELVKKLIVFCMFFVATRDIITAFVLTILYVILIDGIFHENRKFTVLSTDEIKNEAYEKYLRNIYILRSI